MRTEAVVGKGVEAVTSEVVESSGAKRGGAVTSEMAESSGVKRAEAVISEVEESLGAAVVATAESLKAG